MAALGWRALLSAALIASWQLPSAVRADDVQGAGSDRKDMALVDTSSKDFVTVASSSLLIDSTSKISLGNTDSAAPLTSDDSLDEAAASEGVTSDRRRRRGGGYSSRRRIPTPSYNDRRRYSPTPSYNARRRYSPTPSPSYNARRRYSDSRRRYYYDSGRRRFGGHYVWQRRRRQWQNAAAFGVGAGFAYYAITGNRRRLNVWMYGGPSPTCQMAPAYTVQSGGVPAANVPAIQGLCAQMLNSSTDPQTTCFSCDQCQTDSCVNGIPGCATFTQTLYYQCQDPHYGSDDFMTWLSSVFLICLCVCCVCCIIGCIVRAVNKSNQQARDVQMSLISDPGPGSFNTGGYPAMPQPMVAEQTTPFDDRYGHPPMQQPFNQPYPVYANQGVPAMGAPGQMGPQQFPVQVPLGTAPGASVQVTAPNGQLVQVLVPPGVGPGQQFMVQL